MNKRTRVEIFNDDLKILKRIAKTEDRPQIRQLGRIVREYYKVGKW